MYWSFIRENLFGLYRQHVFFQRRQLLSVQRQQAGHRRRLSSPDQREMGVLLVGEPAAEHELVGGSRCFRPRVTKSIHRLHRSACNLSAAAYSLADTVDFDAQFYAVLDRVNFRNEFAWEANMAYEMCYRQTAVIVGVPRILQWRGSRGEAKYVKLVYTF